MRVAAGFAVLSALLFGACSSTPYADIAGLAESPARPYSVLVTGGAFLKKSLPATSSGYGSTYSLLPGEDEVVGLDMVVDVLQRGKVFARVEQDMRDSESRRNVVEPDLSSDDKSLEVRELLKIASKKGHDLLLVVEEFKDGFVERRGMNGQWPITGAVWLLVGLGMVIPDHTYASQASMRVTLRDVHTGRLIDDPVFSGGAVDLSLLERTDFLGILTSIVVPPFWVGDDPESVISSVRPVTTRQLLAQTARRMKSLDVKTDLDELMPAEIVVSRSVEGLLVKITSDDPLSEVAWIVDVDRERGGIKGDRQQAFGRKLLATKQEREGSYHYEAVLMSSLDGNFLQILVSTVAGGVASMTFPLGGR